METSATASHAAEEGLGSAKNRRVLSIAFIVVVGTWLATVFHYVLGIYKSKPYPLNTYLFRANDNFMDFYNNLNSASGFMSGKKEVIAYSPFAHTVMGALSIFPARLALALAMTAFMVTVGLLVWRFFVDDLKHSRPLRLVIAFVMTAMTYPVLFTLDRGNEEAFVFIALAWFTYLYFVEHSRWAGVLLGMAIAYKMYPGVLVVLFVADRRWKDLLITGATTLGLTAACTFLLGAISGYGPVAVLRYWFNTLFVGHVGYSGTLEAAQHGHSLWGAVVTLLGWLQGGEPTGLSTRAYVIVALLSFVALSAYVVLAEKSDWKRSTLLVIAMLILPLESHDYTLIHLLIPIAMFANSKRNRLDMMYTVLFGLLLVPLDYYIVIKEVSCAAFIYPAALLAIVALIVGQRFMRRMRPLMPAAAPILAQCDRQAGERLAQAYLDEHRVGVSREILTPTHTELDLTDTDAVEDRRLWVHSTKPLARTTETVPDPFETLPRERRAVGGSSTGSSGRRLGTIAGILASGWAVAILVAWLTGSFSRGLNRGLVESLGGGLLSVLEAAHHVVSTGFDYTKATVVGTPLHHLILLLLAPLPVWYTATLMAGAALAGAIFLLRQATNAAAPPGIRGWVQVAFIALASFPALAAAATGDTYALGFMAVLGFVYFYYFVPSSLAYAALAVAIALNPAALALLLVLVLDRRVRAAVAVTVAALATEFASILLIAFVVRLPANPVLMDAARVLRRASDKFGFRAGDLAGSNSLWTPFSAVGALVAPGRHTAFIEATYALLAVALFALGVFALIRTRAGSRTVLMVAAAFAMVLPFTSPSAATLLVVALIAAYVTRRERWRYEYGYAAVFALLLMPLDLIRVPWQTVVLLHGATPTVVGLGAIVRPLALLALVVLLLIEARADAPAADSETKPASQPAPLPFRPKLDTSTWLSVRWLGLVVVVIATATSQLIIYNRFLPLQEGWFTVFGNEILAGHMPYRDFYLFIPPVYAYLTAGLIKLFGPAFIVFRTWGVFERVLLAALLYLVVEKSFKARSAVIATLLGIAVFASNNSDIIHGYTQFTLIFVLAATFLVLLSIEKPPRTGYLLVSAAGFLAGLGFVTKQSLGLFAIVALGFALVAIYVRREPIRALWSAASFAGSAILVPALTVLWLWQQGALGAALGQVFGGASSKGSLGSVLFGFIGRTLTPDDLLFIGIVGAVILVRFIARRRFRLPGKSEIANSAGTRIQILAVGVAALAGSLLPRLLVGQFTSLDAAAGMALLKWESTHWAFYCAAVLSLILTHYVLFRKPNRFAQQLLVVSIVSLMASYAYGLSFSLDLASTVPAMSVAIGAGLLLLVRPIQRYGRRLLIPLLLAFMLVIGMISVERYNSPYAWWGWSEPSVGELSRPYDRGVLKGMQLSTDTADVFTDVTDTIKRRTPEGSTLFTYPHIPVFYSLSGRKPVTFGLVHYYDVMPDPIARADARRLLANPPDSIVMLWLPESAKTANEKAFRSGKRSGQRDIEEAVMTLLKSGHYVRVDKHLVYGLGTPGSLGVYIKKRYVPGMWTPDLLAQGPRNPEGLLLEAAND